MSKIISRLTLRYKVFGCCKFQLMLKFMVKVKTLVGLSFLFICAWDGREGGTDRARGGTGQGEGGTDRAGGGEGLTGQGILNCQTFFHLKKCFRLLLPHVEQETKRKLLVALELMVMSDRIKESIFVFSLICL